MVWLGLWITKKKQAKKKDRSTVLDFDRLAGGKLGGGNWREITWPPF
jgi:hypothetical protein